MCLELAEDLEMDELLNETNNLKIWDFLCVYKLGVQLDT